jgi:hypothetical protein
MQKAARIGQIAIVQDKFSALRMRVLIEMVNAVCVKEGTTPLDAMNLVAFV